MSGDTPKMNLEVCHAHSGLVSDIAAMSKTLARLEGKVDLIANSLGGRPRWSVVALISGLTAIASMEATWLFSLLGT